MAGPIPFNELERERFRGIAYTGFSALGYALQIAIGADPDLDKNKQIKRNVAHHFARH